MRSTERNNDSQELANRRLKSLQECRAALERSEQQAQSLIGLLKTTAGRIEKVETQLGVYFAATKNPVKVLVSRMAQPRAMRRNRKGIEEELKTAKKELKGWKPSAPVPNEPVVERAETKSSAEEATHHVIITGTGRAGTTFLMQLLTSLGLDTGFQHASETVNPNANAGLEQDIREESAAYIVKNPALCDYLEDVLAAGKVVIDHAFVPVRDIRMAAQSRARISAKAPAGKMKVAGGFWDAEDAEQQEMTLMRKLSGLVVTLGLHNVPTTLLAYPRLVEDAPYLYTKFSPILEDIDFSTFKTIFDQVSRPALVSRNP